MKKIVGDGMSGKVECRYCDGTGRVDKDGNSLSEDGYRCPECKGLGSVTQA